MAGWLWFGWMGWDYCPCGRPCGPCDGLRVWSHRISSEDEEVAFMARRAKLTQEMVDEAIRLKGDGLADADIICALGIHPSTFYRWKNEPKNRLQRELGEGLKKEEAEFKHTLLTTIRAAALARNQYWTAAAWLLERKYPDEYGKADRRRDDAEANDAPRIVLGVVAKPVQERLDLSFDGEAVGLEGDVGSSRPSGDDSGEGSSQGKGSSSSPDSKDGEQP